MKTIARCAVLAVCVWPLVVACGSDTSPSSSGGGAAGAAAGSSAAGVSGASLAGAAGQGLSAGAGGAAAGAAQGGAAQAGASQAGASAGGSGAGATNQAGAGGSAGSSNNGGAAGDPGRPLGVVKNCFGDGCPLGECSSISAKQCADVYPGPLTADSMLCTATGSAQYCVTVAKTWAIVCATGTPTLAMCQNGCNWDMVKKTATCF